MESFGDKLRRLRGERSQKEIASGIGMPTTTLASLEAQPLPPRGEVLSRLANYFKVPIDYFYRTASLDLKPSDAARAWLQTLKEPVRGKETIATMATGILDEPTKQRIAQRIREKHSEKVSSDE